MVGQEITGYQGLAIDVWLSQRSYEALAEVSYDERQDGADDILKILQNGFPAGLATSRTEYQSNLIAATPLNIKSLGEAVSMRWLDSHSTLSVYRVDLSTADKTVKVWGTLAASWPYYLFCMTCHDPQASSVRMHRTCTPTFRPSCFSSWMAPTSSILRSQGGSSCWLWSVRREFGLW